MRDVLRMACAALSAILMYALFFRFLWGTESFEQAFLMHPQFARAFMASIGLSAMMGVAVAHQQRSYIAGTGVATMLVGGVWFIFYIYHGVPLNLALVYHVFYATIPQLPATFLAIAGEKVLYRYTE